MKFFSNLAAGLALAGLAFATPTPTLSDTVSPVKRATAASATHTYGLATYWGQPGGSIITLTNVCQGASYSHVNLAFLTNYFAQGGWPSFNLDRLGPSSAQINANASYLVDGSSLENAIKICQANGKKVLLSVGGETGTGYFSASKYAEAAATNLFNLFLGGSNATTAPIRPFGTVVLDGIDLDPENAKPAYYTNFVSALRTKMKADTTHTYIITAAPQCPRNLQSPPGDASLPDAVLQLVDHVWVQFYNNAPNLCNHGLSNFQSSVKAWSAAIKPAKLWIGSVGNASLAATGYINSSAIVAEQKTVRGLGLTNLGGYMLYDAEGSYQNANYQVPLRNALP